MKQLSVLEYELATKGIAIRKVDRAKDILTKENDGEFQDLLIKQSQVSMDCLVQEAVEPRLRLKLSKGARLTSDTLRG